MSEDEDGPRKQGRTQQNRSNFEAPEGMQVESPEHMIDLEIEDSQERMYQLGIQLDRLQTFGGNRSDALAEGKGDDTDHQYFALLKWRDKEYENAKQFLIEQGFTIHIIEDSDSSLAVKQVSIDKAFQARLDLHGAGGPVKQADDLPNVYYKREMARRALGELEMRGEMGNEVAGRDRSDREYKDREDVPWKDDTDSDPYGQGVQTVDIREATKKGTPKGKLIEVQWLQEKKVYGPIQVGDTWVEGVIGRETTARPFHDLIIPAKFTWWDIYNDQKKIMTDLKVSNFTGIWNFMSQIKKQIDDGDCEFRGMGYLPWGEPCVRVMIEIPPDLLKENPHVTGRAQWKSAKYFVFEVTGAAVPALKDECDLRLRSARKQDSYKPTKAQIKRGQKILKAMRVIDTTKKVVDPKLVSAQKKYIEGWRKKRLEWEKDPKNKEWVVFSPPTTLNKAKEPSKEWLNRQKLLNEDPVKYAWKYVIPALAKDYPGICKNCGRRLSNTRLRGLQELYVMEWTNNGDISSLINTVSMMELCTVKFKREKRMWLANPAWKNCITVQYEKEKLTYCDGSDLGATRTSG